MTKPLRVRLKQLLRLILLLETWLEFKPGLNFAIYSGTTFCCQDEELIRLILLVPRSEIKCVGDLSLKRRVAMNYCRPPYPSFKKGCKIC